MRTTIALAEVYSHLRHSSFAISVEQLRTVGDDSVVFLTRAGQETGHVYQADDGDVEGVAETYEACTLAASIHIEHTSVNLRLVGYDTHALTVETSETDDDVLCKIALHFEELTIVHHCANHFIHVVCHVGVVGDDFVEECFFAVDGVRAFHARSALAVVLGEEREQTADETCEFFFSLCTEMCYTALLGVHTRTAKFFLCHLFARHRFHHFRTSEEHVAHAFEHHDEVGQSRRVNCTTSAGTADARNLGHYTRGFDVALENVGKTSQSVDTLLDACTT